MYKGMLMPVQVGQYFPELQDPDMEWTLPTASTSIELVESEIGAKVMRDRQTLQVLSICS